MSLVNLIKKVESADRDAIIQIEDYLLPREAKFIGRVDALGRSIYSLFENVEVTVDQELNHITATWKKNVEPVVEADTKTVETDANTVVGDVETEIEKLWHEAGTEAESLINKLEGK